MASHCFGLFLGSLICLWICCSSSTGHQEAQRINVDTSYKIPGLFGQNDVPDSINWNLTEVVDEGDCQCSWAFGVAGALEGLKYRMDSTLVQLSAQNLIDCSKSYGTNGCQNSRSDDALRYVIDNGGIASETNYSYTATDDGPCKYVWDEAGSESQVRPTGYVQVTNGDEETLRQIVGLLGPVAATIVATDNFISYTAETGIFSDTNCTIIDGGSYRTVLITGYGNDGEDQDYWVLKNSLGTSWGDSGYMKMARNKNNMCGIASMAIIPVA